MNSKSLLLALSRTAIFIFFLLLSSIQVHSSRPLKHDHHHHPPSLGVSPVTKLHIYKDYSGPSHRGSGH
uniref:Transmembrane protein n=1 Tax=Cucumis melo TaxID=3656 RepID=A0A9I9EHU2_CUCME